MKTWKEQLAFAPLEAADRGEEVGRRLRHAIELGVLEDGSQLPSESYLASAMGVSTLTLRAALAELRGLGLVETRRGKGGGSFVKANTGDIARIQRQSLVTYSLEDLRDLREYHAFLAGSAAAAAAGACRSHRLSTTRLEHASAGIEVCEQPADAIRADSKFHIELAASSGSVRLTRQEVALQAEVGPLLWLEPAGHKDVAAEDHARIVEAIRAGDPVLARELAEEHIRRDMNRVIDQRMELSGTPVGLVDSAGTNENLISCSKRVIIAGNYLGVVAADFRVSQLQTAFEPLLRSLPPNTCITDQHGAVIATNTGRLVGAAIPAARREACRSLPEVPWSLCIGFSEEDTEPCPWVRGAGGGFGMGLAIGARDRSLIIAEASCRFCKGVLRAVLCTHDLSSSGFTA